MDWTSGVAMQFMLSTGDSPANRGARRDGFIDASARAALFIDLALIGRLRGPETLSIETDPTGFPPADLLLGEIKRDPSRDLGWWIGRGPKVFCAMADQWVQEGRWERTHGVLGFGRRYIDSSEHAVTAGRARMDGMQAVAAGHPPASILEAAVTAAALIAGLVRPGAVTGPGRVPRDLSQACGAAGWLVEFTDLLLADARLRAAEALAFRSGGHGA